ncbi:hypothetical protein F5050DRAFT_1812329 [Lentinula boryana]|uniref:Histidine kinase domain-containing protein n=1 Tax=Lentinula boryana TaxID=40481 RepID=A0ABQ8PZ22_9AGAR|nr:hypothetical protein F5050DRAFT_1812329 [Lentinula boryana]
MLANPSQSCLFWGPARTLIYNNAWARIVSGSKHPHLMGVPGRIAFHEIWDTFSVHCESGYQGKHVGRVDDLLFFDSQPSGELTSASIRDDDLPPKLETYFTLSYHPIQAENGELEVLIRRNNCIETTDKVLSERRMLTVHTLAEHTALTRTTAEFWQAVFDSLTQNEHDFPFFLCYSATTTASSNAYAAETISNSSCDLRSEYSYSSSSTAAPGHPAAPSRVELTSSIALESHRSWPFSKACFGRTPLRAKNLHPEGFQARSWGDTPGDAILIPIHGADDMLVGLVLFGLNTRRPYDEHHTNFHQTLLLNLNLSYVAAQAFEREMQRTEELQALDRAKTMFFQNVSHELRTPLTLFKGPCEDALKEEGKLDLTSRSRFKLIYRASGRLLRLPVRLGPVTRDLASLFRSAIEKAGINYTVDCGELDDAREVFVNLSMWEKIVFNLLSNAIKYTNEGSITLLLRFHSTEVKLRVEDSGCGIPEDQKELVLQRFHRIAYAQGRSHEGTGIGLALTSELVKLHGGHIKVESTLGKGSSFIVRLPRGYSHLPAQDIARNVDHASINKAGYSNVNLHHDHDELELGRDPSKELGYGSYAEGIVKEANGWLSDDSETASTLSVSSEPGTESSGSPQPLCILLAEDNADVRSYIKTILSTIVQVVIAVPRSSSCS